MSDDKRRRLRRHIQRFGKVPEKKSTSNAQAYVLAGLNVLQSLEEAAHQYVRELLWNGPGSYTGKEWASVVIWLREKGYYNYKELTLFGVWAVKESDGEALLVGTRKLAYSAPIYNSESYQRLIKRDFTAYYGEGQPPEADDVIHRATWAVDRRLALRQEIRDVLIQYLRLTNP